LPERGRDSASKLFLPGHRRRALQARGGSVAHLADDLIAQRGREKYVRAAGYLRKSRALYHRLGQLPEWEAIIAGLREKNRNLRALQEELKNAGL
jgi:uncharacterized Zn finger protein